MEKVCLPSEELAKRKWIKGTLLRPISARGADATGCCILGAFHICGYPTTPKEAYDQLEADGLGRPHGSDGCSIVDFNDDECRSKDEAIEFLKRVERRMGLRKDGE